MKKIYLILPDNIPLLLCGKGYTDAFNRIGLFAAQSIISELEDDKVINFIPDYLMFFDFSDKNEELINKIYKNNKNCIFIFYITEKAEKGKELFIKKITDKKLRKLILTADKENLKLSDEMVYLPLGINAKKYKPDFKGYTNTVNISANFECKKALELFEFLNKFFDKTVFYCDETEYMKSIESDYFLKFDEETKSSFRKSYKGSLSNEKERSKVFSESFINIILNDKMKNGVNFSILEAAASCGIIFCEQGEEIKRLFDIGCEAESFDNFETLIQKAEFYMTYPEIGRSVGLNARRAAINNHSVYDRVKDIIRITNKKFKLKEKNNE